MTNPDLPAPADLTLHTVTETQLVDAMIANMQIALPEWEAQEGATEILVMEAAALAIGQFVFALNQLPRVVLDGLVSLHGITRNPAVPASGQITVTLAAGSIGTRTLPAGARFRVDQDNGLTVDMLVAEDTVLNPADTLLGVVNVTADVPGAAPNGTPIGTSAVMVDSYTWIETAVVSLALHGGADIETDTVYYSRAAATLQEQSATLVTTAHFAAQALRNPAVGRAKAFSLWDGGGAVGTMQGHVTVAIAAPDGTDVTGPVAAAVLTDLMALAVAGLQVHVVNFTHQAMTLTVTYTPAAGFDVPTVSVGIETVLRAWLNPATWPLSDTLTSVNQIILKIGTVPGVANVTSVTGWSAITGGATLPSITAITITPA